MAEEEDPREMMQQEILRMGKRIGRGFPNEWSFAVMFFENRTDHLGQHYIVTTSNAEPTDVIEALRQSAADLENKLPPSGRNSRLNRN